jgi:UDP-N-acetylglucosamine transferase subunit ALG13
MIFVTVGTNEARFDRLLRAVADLRVDEPLLVQHGHSSPIPHPQAELVDFLTFDAMVDAISAARVVVTHAGVGSVLVCLANGKRPVVVPRLSCHDEAVDDHQLQLGRRFAEAGLVTLVESLDGLPAAIESEQATAETIPSASRLAGELRSYLESAVAPTAASPARA